MVDSLLRSLVPKTWCHRQYGGTTHFAVQEVLDRWLSAAKQHLEVVKGWQSARLLEADASDGGRLRVLFSSRLSQVVTSVRSVAALGYRIPRDLDSAVQVPAACSHSISVDYGV